MAQVTTGIRKYLGYSIVYETFQSFVGADKGRTRFVDRYVRPFSGARIIDIGCGPGTLIEYLPREITYAGFDNNPEYIRTAREKYGDRGSFFCADAGSDEGMGLVSGEFDIVIASALLHHLDDDQAHQLLETAWKYLKPGGAFVTIDGTFVPGQNPIAKFIIANDRGKNVRTPEEYVALADRRFSRTESFVVTDLLRIPYTHCILRASKS